MSKDHQYIVTLKGYCPPLKALVYELMDGGSLLDFIKNEKLRKRYGFRRRVAWLYHVASALAFLHHGFDFPIRHWDIKPSNILLDQNHRIAKIADMGLAKYFSMDSKTSTGPHGTAAYLDPIYV